MSRYSNTLIIEKELYSNNKRVRRQETTLYKEIPKTDSDIYVITQMGDRLDLLSKQFYKDIRLWWVIANANRDIVRRDSYVLKPGLEIRIPANIPSILNDFELINA